MDLFRMPQRIASGQKIDRREMMRAMAALGIGVTAVPLLPNGARASDGVTYFTWSGYEVPELHPQFIEKHGDGLVAGTFFGNEDDALGKLRTGFKADVSHPCSYSIPRWKEAGVVAPIDVSRLSNWPDLFEGLSNTPDAVRDGEVYMVPFDWGSASVLYRTDLVDPKYVDDPTWGILYDEAYAGRMAMYNSSVIVDIAMMVSGYDNYMSYTDEQIAEVRPLMEKGHSLWRFYWDDPTEVSQGLASGELVAAYAWNGMPAELLDQGVPIEYMNPKEGQITWVCGLAIDPRGEADEQLVYDFIDAMISPEAGVFQMEVYNYGHANRKAFDKVSPETLARIGMADPDEVFNQGVFIPAREPELEEKLIRLSNEIQSGF
ncbi:MAG: extracellular solute-binding protein [Pseudomonadota bacterium]